MKNAPNRNFLKSKFNTTTLESEGNNKFIKWCVELAFIVIKNSENLDKDVRGIDSKIEHTIILNEDNMIHEETSLASFINKDYLK